MEVSMLRCASCGKTEDEQEGTRKLKTCTACKSVKYCSVECQRNHRKVHKKDCKRIEKELLENKESDLDDADDDEDLFKPQPREECPFCFLPLRIDIGENIYSSCCGKQFCGGCHLKHNSVWSWSNFKRALKDPPEPPTDLTCAFCREPAKVRTTGSKYRLQRIQKRMSMNDPGALRLMATYYRLGMFGLTKDEEKSVTLYQQAVDRGSSAACWHLVQWYHESDRKAFMHYLKLGAKRGNILCRELLGFEERNNNNIHLAMKHWMISAAAGRDASLKAIGEAYRIKCATKDQFEEVIRTNQKAKEEMQSFERDMFLKFENSERDMSVFSEAELAKLSGVRESEHALLSLYRDGIHTFE